MLNVNDMNIYQRTGLQVRRIRMEKGISQSKLASELSMIGRSHLVNIERGKSSFSLDSLEEIAKVLGVKLRDFFPG